MSAADDPDVQAIARIGAVPTILRVITETTGLRLALIARVTADDWKACAVHDALGFGLAAGGHLDVATTLCSEVRDGRTPIVIEHASADPIYCGHPTPKLYKFESYVAVPIFLRGGEYYGNVCALDARPLPLRERNAEAMMTLFAQLIALELEAEDRAVKTQAALLDARQTSELREQFIAVLGHDLRSPLSAILAGAEMLLDAGLPGANQKIAERIRSSGRRMARLVEDVLDFARGRLGGGIPTDLAVIDDDDLESTFRQVVDELRATHPARTIRLQASQVGLLRGDRGRLGQLLTNLLANALEHSPDGGDVRVLVEGTARELTLAVENGGDPIPPETLPRLFQPYFRAAPAHARRGAGGLGLGLYIVAEIVRSHGGTIAVTSTREGGTSFRCTLPRNL